jgi:hypothetical protein
MTLLKSFKGHIFGVASAFAFTQADVSQMKVPWASAASPSTDVTSSEERLQRFPPQSAAGSGARKWWKNVLVSTLTGLAEMPLGSFPQAKESSHVNRC